jgi:hypothetical protein
MLKKILSLFLLASGLFAADVSAGPTDIFSVQNSISQFNGQISDLSPQALQLGLKAYKKIREEGLDRQQILTIVDYTKPSTDRRLWVLDLKNHKVLFNVYVAHGQNSGGNYASSFSDHSGSLKSSLGVFLTENSYQGKHGYSLRVKGLENGVNEKAESRDIVVHSANYVTEHYVQEHGRLGRSWGCFAVNPRISNSLIQTIKGGTVIFAYYPDASWMSKSEFLA